MRHDYELRYGIPGDIYSRSVKVTCTEKQLPVVGKAVMRGENATWILAKHVDPTLDHGAPAFFYATC